MAAHDTANPPEAGAGLVVKVAEAKTRLSELIARAEAGERVVIARGRDPAVELTPIRPKKRPLGILRRLAPQLDFDKLERDIEVPYTEEELDEIEGDLDEELKNA